MDVVFTQSSTLISYTPEYNASASWYIQPNHELFYFHAYLFYGQEDILVTFFSWNDN